MPTYEYRCMQCGKNFSKVMTLGEHARNPRPSCPRCQSRKVAQRPSPFQAVTGKKA